MKKTGVCDIWSADTGIKDLPESWQNLAVPAISDLKEIWKQEYEKLKGSEQLREFNERLAREWAIETGVIEDVFHIDKRVTVNLIEQGISAALLEHGSVDKSVEYVIHILQDHVKALDWLLEKFVAGNRQLTVGAVKELHSLMTAHQTHVDAHDADGRPIQVELIRGEWKQRPNNLVRDGIMYRYCPPEQTQSEMERLIAMHITHRESGVPTEVQAAWLHHRFTQIHPFQDGNGRVARALASLVFLRAGLFPLVITREMRKRYIHTLEQADRGDLKPLVELMAEAQQQRFDKALNIAEDLLQIPSSVEAAIESLKAKYAAREAEVVERQRAVFKLAERLEQEAMEFLTGVAERLKPVPAIVSRSDNSNDYYYRYQIITEARRMNYYANTTDYRTWVRLTIAGDTQALLILSFHARGPEFRGILVCTPLLEIVNKEEEASAQRLLIPVNDKPFEFYFTERDEAGLVNRFRQWLNEVLAVAITQYQKLI